MCNRLFGLTVAVCLLAFSARAEYRLSETEIAEEVKKEFAEHGMENVDLDIFGGKTEYYFEQADNAKIMLSDFDIDEEQGRFSSDVEIFADGEQVAETKLVGRYYQMVKVWVPAKDITKGSLIGENDLQETTVRASRLKGGAYSAKDDIVGKQAAKFLKSGKLIEINDLQAEIIIKKGQTVTAMYTKKGLQITSKMQALDNAAQGQPVKLLNLSSKKEIVGWAKAAGLVEIGNE